MHYLYSEKDQADFYMQDDVHFPHVLTPLYASFQLPNQEEGTRRAFERLQGPLERFSLRLYRGRFYQRNVPFQGDSQLREQRHREILQARLPVIMDYFQERLETVLLPYYARLKESAAKVSTPSDALSLICEMHQFYATAWDIHFDIILPRVELGFMLEDLYKRMTGAASGQPVYDLLIGVMNKSLETDQAFWRLADRIKQDRVICNLILASEAQKIPAALRDSERGRQLLDEMAQLLDIYGYRTSYSHEFIHESWVENPKYAWDLVRIYLQKDYDFNADYAALRAHREAAFAQLMDSVADSEIKQTFARLYSYALLCWGLDEDHHFYIDTMLPMMYRPVLIRIGAILCEQNVVEQPEDVFFLYFEEVCELLVHPTDSRTRVRERKREYAEFCKEDGVPHLGPVPPAAGEDDLLVDRLFGLPKFLKENTKTLVKGYAASRGTHTGTVKVVRDQDEFSKVTHGDVLVCKSTTPPWTVLFSVAGAIVTDAGGVLSHAGTVAREYAIPAVLGTKVATRTFRDGDVVTVDGTAGTVVVSQT